MFAFWNTSMHDLQVDIERIQMTLQCSALTSPAVPPSTLLSLQQEMEHRLFYISGWDITVIGPFLRHKWTRIESFFGWVSSNSWRVQSRTLGLDVGGLILLPTPILNDSANIYYDLFNLFHLYFYIYCVSFVSFLSRSFTLFLLHQLQLSSKIQI